MITARKGELDWGKLRREPLALPRAWTTEETVLALAATALLAFMAFLEVLGGITFWHRLVG